MGDVKFRVSGTTAGPDWTGPGGTNIYKSPRWRSFADNRALRLVMGEQRVVPFDHEGFERDGLI